MTRLSLTGTTHNAVTHQKKYLILRTREVNNTTFTAYIEWDPETKLYVGIVPGIPGAHTQGATLDELQTNLKEVLALCLEEYKGSTDELPRFMGLQQIEIAI